MEDQRVETPQPNRAARHHQQAQVYIVQGAATRPAAQSYQQGGNQYAEHVQENRRAHSAGRGQHLPEPRQNQAPQYQAPPVYIQPSQAAGQDQQYQAGFQEASYHYEYEGDGYSERADACYLAPQPNQHRSIHSRLGGQALQAGDQRHALDYMQEARLQEEAVPPGPRCFTSRIMSEPKPEGTF